MFALPFLGCAGSSCASEGHDHSSVGHPFRRTAAVSKTSRSSLVLVEVLGTLEARVKDGALRLVFDTAAVRRNPCSTPLSAPVPGWNWTGAPGPSRGTIRSRALRQIGGICWTTGRFSDIEIRASRRRTSVRQAEDKL